MRCAVNRGTNSIVVRLDKKECADGKHCDYILENLCRDYECELMGRPYRIGTGYLAQNFLCRKTWRWYTMECQALEEELRTCRKKRFYGKQLTPEMLEQQGYKADEESLRAMGLLEIGGKIAVRRIGNDMR